MCPSLLSRVLFFVCGMIFLASPIVSFGQEEGRCYELRTYTAGPGKLPDLHARFRNHTMRLFEKHGMTNIGYWVPIENSEHKLIYMLSYPSRTAREKSWKEFRADPSWQAIKAASDASGPLAAAVEEKFLEPTAFSPEVKPCCGADRRVFELRTYTATAGNLDRLLRRSFENTDWLFKLYNIHGMGAWTLAPGQDGAETTMIQLLTHASVEAGAEAFRQLRDDKDWIAIKEASEAEAGTPLVLPKGGIRSIYMVATDYSPTK